LGLSQSAVANKLRLLRHSLPVQQRLRETNLTERHARALLKLPSEQDKLRAIEAIAAQDMNVARTEQYILSLLTPNSQKPTKTDIVGFLKHISATLTKFQSSGISAVSERKETDKEIVLTITIPK
jgi:ParB family chromosome partitioning protein